MVQKKKKSPTKKEAEQIVEAIDYRLQGHSYEMIAEQMKVPASKAVELVHAGLATLIHDDDEQRMLVDLARIDQMLTAIYPSATQGDRESVTTILQLRRERDELQRKWNRQESFRRFAPVDDGDGT